MTPSTATPATVAVDVGLARLREAKVPLSAAMHKLRADEQARSQQKSPR